MKTALGSNRRWPASAAWAASVAALLVTAPTGAAEHRTYATGAMLLRALASEKNYEQGIARGYVGAVADIGAGEPVNGFLFCVPAAVTLEQMGSVVRDWLQQHPESRNYAGKGVVGAALAEAYPCTRK
jgi:hypothetical protein